MNLSLTDIETEKFVGSYRCDILCRDEITGKVVLIENQLEQTNHDHLGKILTYASGLDASVVVWVVASARDEHEIESTLGFELSWQRMNHRKSSRICKYIEGLDFTIQDNYAELMNESIDLVVRMRDALSEYIQAEP